MVIKRFEPRSVGKVAGVLYAAVGLFIGIIVSFAATIGGLAGRSAFGALGFIVAFIAAWLYNLAAGYVGGIEIDLQ
jgi:hypothetical protein